MWEKFTERAKRVIFFAQEEAGKLGENNVLSEHLLLGLLREKNSIATITLEDLKIDPEQLRETVKGQTPPGNGKIGQDMQLSPRSKKVIDRAYEEARFLDNNYIGTEHLLLGLIREKEGTAGKVLTTSGASLDKARNAVRKLQSGRDQDIREKSREVVRNLIGGDVAQHPLTLVALKTTHRLRGRSIMSIDDLSKEEIDLVLSVATLLKATGKKDPTAHQSILAGQTLAMIFEKPSLRTRVTFEVGMTQLGGHAIYLAPSDIQLGQRESVADVSRNLSRWCDVIMARVFSHGTVTGLANNASIPVINGLSDLEHPCQALADFLTIQENKHGLRGLKLAFIGDGNNVAQSLMLLAAKVGMRFALACPEGYDPDAKVVERAREIAASTGSTIEIVRDPSEAVEDADVIYTDVWASMGQEDETAERKKVFAAYQVNSELVAKAKSDAIVLHCLPAHRGDEITDEVLDGPQSFVLDEAENRLHVQKAIMSLIV